AWEAADCMAAVLAAPKVSALEEKVLPLIAPEVIVPETLIAPVCWEPGDNCTKPELSMPSKRSLLNACGTAVNCTRGVISASLPTLIPKYSALLLKSTLPGSAVLEPRFTWNNPPLTATVPCVSSHLQV